MEGTIRFFNQEHLYGFVQIEGAQSYFFHHDEVLGEPVTRGDTVTFQIDDDLRRPGELKAVDVQKSGSASTPDPTRLFIANLPYTVSEAVLADCLGQFGSVKKVEIIRDSETGESRGFGFVANK